MSTLVITLLLLSLPFSNPASPPAFSIAKIEQGELLDKAKAATLEVFFESWMDRNAKKATDGSWIILYKNDEFLYWGWTSFKILMSANPTVKEFFKTPMVDIQEKFPNYEEVHGNSIREKLEAVITKSVVQQAKVTVKLGFKAQLIGETIVIQTPCTIKARGEDAEKATYNIILNRDNLDLIKLEAI
ncbi:hypothetical protein [Aureispira anguillae]|uniref:Uncharacterized protein n=1 Tax=Aureispira anguillae TaxID=2864201 RepID=A0A915YKL2_9BACT|nr:hypothetical protein [Aureispira anguillae]BDS14939.1 hypothetical protein AsAng_0057210 [Aureispira anguillae]